MVRGWKSVAMIVGIVIIVGIIVVYMASQWTDIVNGALCTIQENIGLEHHFHIPNSSGGTYACPHI